VVAFDLPAKTMQTVPLGVGTGGGAGLLLGAGTGLAPVIGGAGAMVPVVGGALTAIGAAVPALAGGIAGLAAGAYGIYDLLTAGGLIDAPWNTPTGEGFQAGWSVSPPADFGAIRTWSTGTNKFWANAKGRIGCYKKNGAWKSWMPAKHIVISRNPRIKTLGKLAKLNKRVEKMLKPYQPKAKPMSAKALAGTYLSTAERKALKA